jgi:metal-responsive CopG/Arc/MetJ family transcriptional regulator
MVMQRTNYYYPKPLLKRVKKAAQAKGITSSEYIRQAVEAALDKAENEESSNKSK